MPVSRYMYRYDACAFVASFAYQIGNWPRMSSTSGIEGERMPIPLGDLDPDSLSKQAINHHVANRRCSLTLSF